MLNLDTPLNRRLDPTPLRFPQHVPPDFDVSWATAWSEVREAQRLRYRVFALEMGARVVSQPLGLDADEFDAYCDHLLVRDRSGAAVGTCRVLAGPQAQTAGGMWIERAFDLIPLAHLRPRMAELGRACVDARHRHDDAIPVLWRALIDYMAENDLSTLVGCSTVALTDGGHSAVSLWRRLSRTHRVEPDLEVQPWLPFPVQPRGESDDADAPALLMAGLQLGARVLGAPAWDPTSGCAELPLLLRFDDFTR